jgi:hypothetical protein
MKGNDMPSKLDYKIITAIGEENSQNNNAFEKLKNVVKVYLHEGWRPVGEFQYHQ